MVSITINASIYKMSKNNKGKIFPEKIFKKRGQHVQYPYLKKFILALQQRKVVYPITVFLAVFFIYGYAYSVTGRTIELKYYHPVVRTVDHISNFFLTASILSIVLYLPKNSKNFFEFFTSLYPEGNKLLGPLLAMKKTHFWRNFLISNLSIGTLIALNASFFLINFGWEWYRYIIFRDIQFYLYNLALLLLLAVARKLELRFAELNEILLYKTEHFLKMKTHRNYQETLDTNFVISSEHFYSVRTFRIMHYDLCNLVKRFNDMFGRILLSSIVFTIANIMAKVTFIIEFCVSTKSEEEREVWAYFLGIIGFWIFANLGQGFFFSFYGEQLTKEGEKTTKICFYLLNKVSLQPNSENEKLVQEELKLLAFQSYSKIPCLSAGGFFDINFKVLGLVISSVTSYLMVIVQFLLRPH